MQSQITLKMVIRSAQFVCSNSDVKSCPAPKLPEYAFIGRSNVGKSSLINMLCNARKLAKTSSTPGKTQLINHFLINNSWYIVDLPGYGYARVGQNQREKFSKLIADYINTRTNLMCLFVLVDARLEPQTLDMDFMRNAALNQIPFAIVFTKADKLKPGALEYNIEYYKKTMRMEWAELPHMIISSAEKGMGKDDILSFIEEINNKWEG